ncbi:MAG: cytochrome b5 domain-containing protein [Clostridiaceae bacterium]
MIKNKKIIAANLALMLGTFVFAGCTKDATAGITGNSVESAQEELPTDASGEDATSSATGGKESPGEKGPNGERGATTDEEIETEQTIPDQTFTLNELSHYDGKDGAQAYIAIDGIVYNVTSADGWTEGEHEGYSAGQDLTAAFESSPHKEATLNRLEIIGTLAD